MGGVSTLGETFQYNFTEALMKKMGGQLHERGWRLSCVPLLNEFEMTSVFQVV